jgi:uncharacterized protein
MNVVLDANIYVSALITRDGNPAKILSMWQEGRIDVVASPAIIEEVRRVTGYPKLLNRYGGIRENRDELIATLKEVAIVVEPNVKVSVVEQDESDNRYVECALAGNAAYIVTGDPHLLNVRGYKGVTIVTPAAFLALLSTGSI